MFVHLQLRQRIPHNTVEYTVIRLCSNIYLTILWFIHLLFRIRNLSRVRVAWRIASLCNVSVYADSDSYSIRLRETATQTSFKWCIVSSRSIALTISSFPGYSSQFLLYFCLRYVGYEAVVSSCLMFLSTTCPTKLFLPSANNKFKVENTFIFSECEWKLIWIWIGKWFKWKIQMYKMGNKRSWNIYWNDW